MNPATVAIPVDYFSLLATTTNKNNALNQEHYFVFTDDMSNG
jgi:hypothetical protein